MNKPPEPKKAGRPALPPRVRIRGSLKVAPGSSEMTSPALALARAAAIFAIVFAGSNTAIHFLAPPETTTRMSLVNREVASYLPSLVAAVMARSVPALYEWTVQRRAIRQDSRSASRR